MFQILRVEKLTTWGQIQGSGRHTYRERNTPNADPRMKGMNQHFGARSAVELRSAIEAQLDGLAQKDDTVKCIEYLFTASPQFFINGKGARDLGTAYFKKAREWLEERHGKENVVAISIHADEKSPHMVAYVTPIITKAAHSRKRNVADGIDEQGNRKRKTIEVMVPEQKMLSAKHFLGGREKLSLMQTDFHQKVSRRFDLERGEKGSKATHQKVKTFYATMEPMLEQQKKRMEKLEQDEFANEVWADHNRKEGRKLAEEAAKVSDEKKRLDALTRALDENDQEKVLARASVIYKRAMEEAEQIPSSRGIRTRPIKP